MNDLVFTSYAFGPLYCYQHERLQASILRVYPDANIRFWHSDESSSNDQGRPPGARTFHESMYGFKVHCVRNCLREGFRRVVFLDAAMVLEAPIDDVLERAAEIGVLATDETVPLNTVISDDCLAYVGKTREEIDLRLVGGSVYVFDFDNPVAMQVFEYWEQMEADGMFGSEDKDCRGLLQGHRKDETCMALALDRFGISPVDFDTLGYHNLGGGNANRKFTFYKLHFKGIGQVHEHSLNQTLLPLHANILDLGCRDFKFTDFFRNLEYSVYSVDIAPIEEMGRSDYYRLAIAAQDGRCGIVRTRDPDAAHIAPGDELQMCSIETFTRGVGVKQWDLIKMDIEGAEYDILRTAKHPMAGQITVEFHAHCTNQTKEQLDELLDMLEEHYIIQGREWREEHSAGYNYWDVLMLAKEWNRI